MKTWLIILLAISTYSISAQVQRCGYPNFAPKKGEGNMVIDTCGRLSYLWDGLGTWYCQNNIIANSAPQIEITVSGFKISYKKVAWFKPSANQWYDVAGNAWRGRDSYVIDSLLSSNNRWTGKNTFADTIAAEKGLKSNGLIDTKGLNTEGTAFKAAVTTKGVQADRDTIVNTNFVLSGSYGTVGIDCSSAEKYCVLPDVSQTVNWRFIIRKDDESVNDLVIKNFSNIEIYRLKSKMSVVFKNVNGTWKRQL